MLLASILFVTDQGIGISDRLLKLLIGTLGLLFTAWQLWGGSLRERFSEYRVVNSGRPFSFGLGAGLSSTLAHAAGPVVQMYLLPAKLDKQAFAGTTVFYFLILNGLKLVPFTALGRFSNGQLLSNLWLLPLIPLGVLTGYGLVRIIKQQQYIFFIHCTLIATSLTLILKAL